MATISSAVSNLVGGGCEASDWGVKVVQGTENSEGESLTNVSRRVRPWRTLSISERASEEETVVRLSSCDDGRCLLCACGWDDKSLSVASLKRCLAFGLWDFCDDSGRSQVWEVPLRMQEEQGCRGKAMRGSS